HRAGGHDPGARGPPDYRGRSGGGTRMRRGPYSRPLTRPISLPLAHGREERLVRHGQCVVAIELRDPSHADLFGARGFALILVGVAILELPHVKLAGGGGALRPMRDAVDDHAARAADAFATVVVEGHRVAAISDNALVYDVEHLQERGGLRDVLCVELLEVAF